MVSETVRDHLSQLGFEFIGLKARRAFVQVMLNFPPPGFGQLPVKEAVKPGQDFLTFAGYIVCMVTLHCDLLQVHVLLRTRTTLSVTLFFRDANATSQFRLERP